MWNKTLLKMIAFGISIIVGWAEAAEPIEFQIHGKTVSFFQIPNQHLVLSQDCQKLQCQAYREAKKASLFDLSHRLTGGANPGAVICTHQLHGEVEVGTDAKNNENSFCRFADGSRIDNGSLTYLAIRKE